MGNEESVEARTTRAEQSVGDGHPRNLRLPQPGEYISESSNGSRFHTTLKALDFCDNDKANRAQTSTA